MRVLSIAVCLTVAASLAACEEEPATLFFHDAGPDAGSTDAGRGDAGSNMMMGGMDAGIPAKLPVSTETERAADVEWEIFPLDGGVDNPAQGIMGTVTATAIDGGTQFELSVSNLAVAQTFGAHLHQRPCGDMQGGPHYQNNPAPMGALNDPQYANPQNEVWLDFTTTYNADQDTFVGVAAPPPVKWIPRKGTLGSIVVHERMTGDGGVAGARLACTNMSFDK